MKLLSLYYSLPYPLKVFVASARGHVLWSQRYTKKTEHLIELALERDTWSTDRWLSWQKERLALVLERSAKFVPFYHDMWMKRRASGDRRAVDLLENWPILPKEQVRKTPHAFLAKDVNLHTMTHDHTSGTTGKPLNTWISKENNQIAYSIFEARCKRWYGVSYHDRFAMLGGQLITHVDRKQPPFWVWNRGMNQLYMSSYHLAPHLIPSYLDALVKYKISYIYGYSSSLYELACGVNDNNFKIELKVAIADAEPLFDYQRRAISKAFQCPVMVTYGCTENVISAQECEAGSLHLWPELGFLEIVDLFSDEVTPMGSSGRFICTSLLNTDMPLIRYDLGDVGSLVDPESPACFCGRSLPRLKSLEGRLDDTLYAQNGSKVGRLDPVFKAGVNIKEAQIIQESLQQICVRIVPTKEFDHSDEELITQNLKLRLGAGIQVRFESFESIPREANGKFRAVVNKIDMRAIYK